MMTSEKPKAMTRYHYTLCGLDNVYLENGVAQVSTPHGTGISIQDVEGLHRAIGQWLVFNKRRLNGKEIRFLRVELDMTQATVAHMLDVDVQTVARWEKGQTEVPGPADKVIRLLYTEFIKGNARIRRPLERLAAMDEAGNADIAFEVGDTWQPIDIAA